jgi:hypothetical protein
VQIRLDIVHLACLENIAWETLVFVTRRQTLYNPQLNMTFGAYLENNRSAELLLAMYRYIAA